MKLTRLAIVGATGAALAYFLDPDQGRRRRHMAADRAGGVLRRGRREAVRRAELIAKRAAGAPLDALSELRPADYDDVTLSEKVKTYLFADPRYDGRVNVSAQNGVIVLIGEVDDPDEVVKRVRKIKGVGPIKNLMHHPGEPAPHMA
jgi:hypothetical protein